jgi:predicted nucleic acid-binding protein
VADAVPGGDRVLVDTSAWIDFLQADAAVVRAIDALRRTHQIVLCGQVLQEVLHGSRDAPAFHRLERQFGVWAFEMEQLEDFKEAARIYARLRWKGVTVPPSDCLIAALARRCALKVYATDPDFDRIPDLRRYVP